MWNPDVTVAAICEKDDKFLLVEERAKSSGQIVLNQPAGHLEQGETIIQAVVRETVEETQCRFTPESLIGLYRLEGTEGKTYIRYAFHGSVSEPDLELTLDQDIIRTHWMSLSQIESAHNLRSPLVLQCIHDYLSGISFPLSLVKEVVI